MINFNYIKYTLLGLLIVPAILLSVLLFFTSINSPKIEVFDFPEAGEVINNTNIVTETPRNVENVLEASNFEYKLIGYRIGETDSSVIVKKGNKEFVVFVGEDLEGLYTLIDVNQKEIVFRNEDKLYKITNLVGKSKK
ncbi:MAG: hypothetical protein CBE38_04040 [Gammaproteobacteria bacterium TMED278]|jgi:type II secretory pathway component PulC|nr:hypothetical protein [Gammaproteobacteria bacterium]MAV24259.1 hypothetical protein [Gammaproteobacteria bacterium]OUX41715.1 MAG: hypothetical protein CBE38_04040 [Gammaproteobacteria bacterium TMED278]RCL35498.1 MAG: hypothetical protein DBW99_03960 [SAR86 cluster bacterium]|tara:strand:+ start:840 stop:1253 length:414 start_codon:yes stop_codon:yes gene_type:complete